MGYSVMVPLGVIRPILLVLFPVNQRLPSGPAVILKDSLPVVGNSVMVPLVVICPIWFEAPVNQRLQSGTDVMPTGYLLLVGMGYSVMVPLGVMRPIWFPPYSVYQRLPSGPFVIPAG